MIELISELRKTIVELSARLARYEDVQNPKGKQCLCGNVTMWDHKPSIKVRIKLVIKLKIRHKLRFHLKSKSKLGL